MALALLLPALALTAAAGACAGTLPIALSGIRAERVTVGPNLLDNGGFEAPAGAFPTGWLWDRRNTESTCTVDQAIARSGRRSVKLTNRTGFGAHVYGMLWRSEPVRLKVGAPYTISAWVRSRDPGVSSMMGGAGWQFRVAAPPTGDGWRRIVLTFRPSVADADFTLRFSTESPTDGLWIDDVKLEEGDQATPAVEPDGPIAALEVTPVQAVRDVEGDGPFSVAFSAYARRRVVADARATIAGGPRAARARLSLEPGAWRIVVSGTARAASDSPHRLTLLLTARTGAVSSATADVRFASAAAALRRLAALKRRLPAWTATVDALRRRGADPAYSLVTLTVLRHFVGYAREDVAHGEVRRALAQAAAMERMAARLDARLRAARQAPASLPRVPRWTGTARPTVHGASFLAPARAIGEARAVRRPIFFTGYGAFGQVRSDVERFPAYGVNLIQVEFGPNSVFPHEGAVDETSVRETRRLLDRAAKAGVAVNLLISPHYFPEWALAKWPGLRKRRAGFIQYCIHAPESRDLLKQFVAAAIGPLADHPALHSVCLSNEPISMEEPCEHARAAWGRWLERRHGTVDALGHAYGRPITSFDDVPLPNPFEPHPPSPVWMDYIRFNEEALAEWHRMLADAVRSAAPGLPVHAKAMTWTLLNDCDVIYGADATLFGGFSQISGNDAVNFHAHGLGPFAQGWVQSAMGHDLQRSVLDGPVFNSENHLIPDRDTSDVPPEHVRSVLWQAAVHGQSATTIWVWERTFDARSDFAGSIMHRPECAEAVGLTNHDLNRAARELSALQSAPADVLLLQSPTACVWDGDAYSDCLSKLYIALSSTGLKIGFVSEPQLEQGRLPAARLLFVPAVRHLSEAACRALARWSGPLVLVGPEDCLSRDEYDRARPDRLAGDHLPFAFASGRAEDLLAAISPRLAAWGAAARVRAVDADGRPAWGVEARSVVLEGRTVTNVCNYRNASAKVRLVAVGGPVAFVDVLTGRPCPSTLTLGPLETRLLSAARGAHSSARRDPVD